MFFFSCDSNLTTTVVCLSGTIMKIHQLSHQFTLVTHNSSIASFIKCLSHEFLIQFSNQSTFFINHSCSSSLTRPIATFRLFVLFKLELKLKCKLIIHCTTTSCMHFSQKQNMTLEVCGNIIKVDIWLTGDI